MSDEFALPIAAVVFDIDGTLLTTGGAGAVAWDLAFQHLYGRRANIEDFTEAGLPDHEVCRLTFVGVLGRSPSEAEIAGLLSSYLHHIEAAVAASPGYRIMPGVIDLLDRLSRMGLLLGITTGNVAAAAHAKLARGGLNKYFVVGGYGSDSPDRTVLTQKAIDRAGRLLGGALHPSRVVVVGDTPHDIAAALGVGAVPVGVATGHFSVDELDEAGAAYALQTVEVGFPV